MVYGLLQRFSRHRKDSMLHVESFTLLLNVINVANLLCCVLGIAIT